MNVPLVITGAHGFLGWHVRVLAHALGLGPVVLVDRVGFADPERLAAHLDGAGRVLHLAGVNRGEPAAVADGNIDLARRLADAIGRCATPPKDVAFANSVQAGNGTPYGDAKAVAADVLTEATRWSGCQFTDLRLPNLFGEHGRPSYNSVIATFCHALAGGGAPSIDGSGDRELSLLHVTDAAAQLLGTASSEVPAERRTVGGLAEQLGRFASRYRTGEIPDLATRFDVRLFNTYRSFCFPGSAPLRLAGNTDARGSLFEIAKVHGGGGQTFCSTTKPGVTRGEHFHLAKVERFAVVQGTAEIALRRVLHDDVVRFRVSGDEPAIVDMPTMWAHNITNTGAGDLLTIFWSNDVFDPSAPDTFAEAVA